MSMQLWPIVCVAVWSAEQFRLQRTLECPQRRQRRDRRRQSIPNLCRANGEGAIADGPCNDRGTCSDGDDADRRRLRLLLTKKKTTTMMLMMSLWHLLGGGGRFSQEITNFNICVQTAVMMHAGLPKRSFSHIGQTWSDVLMSSPYTATMWTDWSRNPTNWCLEKGRSGQSVELSLFAVHAI